MLTNGARGLVFSQPDEPTKWISGILLSLISKILIVLMDELGRALKRTSPSMKLLEAASILKSASVQAELSSKQLKIQ